MKMGMGERQTTGMCGGGGGELWECDERNGKKIKVG